MSLFTWSNLIVVAINPTENGEMAVFNTKEEALEKLKNYLLDRYPTDEIRKQAALTMSGKILKVVEHHVVVDSTLSGQTFYSQLKEYWFKDW